MHRHLAVFHGFYANCQIDNILMIPDFEFWDVVAGFVGSESAP